MGSKEELIEVADLLLDVATTMMGAASHTSRIVQSVSRMAEAYGYEVFITIFQKNMTMNLRKKGEKLESVTLVRPTKAMAFSFQIVADLSALSWEVHDFQVPIEQARQKFEAIVSKPRISRWVVLFMVACANASFCKLFNGDLISCALVFLGTAAAFFARQEMMARHLHHAAVFVVAAFISSMISGLGYLMGWGETPEIALATSVLFLIPGVPLINSIMDIMEGHVLLGISRMVNAVILIISISVGILSTMLVLGLEKL